MTLKALLFDKDGTLFHFGATWNTWMMRTIDDFAQGDGAMAARIAQEAGFDLNTQEFLPHSEVIAGTAEDAARALQRGLPHLSLAQLVEFVVTSAAQAPLAPATDLPLLLGDLSKRGLKLGVMTNDSEQVARSNLETAGITRYFDFIAGYDSGYGMKPDPDPLLAFARAVEIAPAQVAMVGDSTHDLRAARAAGMVSIAVLTGVAKTPELAPWADVILSDIGHLPGFLDAQEPSSS